MFLLHVLGAAAEFERELIRERSKAGRSRYLQDFKAGHVGKTASSRSGKNLPPHRPKRIFDRDRVAYQGENRMESLLEAPTQILSDNPNVLASSTLIAHCVGI
jgi:DNA invertase Pin-like site-specific DNA recombinase